MFQKRTCLLALAAAMVFAAGASAAPIPGKALVEYWWGGSDSNLDTLKANANFPDNASEAGMLDGFELPDVANVDNFGARLTAWLIPPQTGEYTFWTASDDDSEVYLSTDDTAANAALICSVEGWTGWRNYAGTEGVVGANQKSAPITLEAGKRYFIQALVADGTGGGHVSVGWAGPGIGDAATPIAGAYVEANVSPLMFIAKNPDPANGMVDVVTPIFQWTSSADAVTDDIYFGTNPNPGAAEFQGTQSSKMPMFFYPLPLEAGAVYYWRVDSKSATGEVYTGKLWSFTVMPVKATEPSPADGAKGQPVTQTLAWKAGQNLPTHDLYFGTDKEAVEAGDASVFKGNLMDAVFEVTEALAYETTYYWRVDELDFLGDKYVGDVWSFTTTLETLGKIKREIWENIGGGTAVTDLTNNALYPMNPTRSDIVTSFRSPDLGISNYGGSMSAFLHVAEPGEYTFWIASDDSSQLLFGATPGTAAVIASVSGWAGDQAWDSNASQKSAVQTLDAGVYFIQALWKEGGGGDHCEVAWQGPGIARQVIPGGYCEPYIAYWAVGPRPTNGATNVGQFAKLAWYPGVLAAKQDIYFGTDAAAVKAATPASALYKGQVDATVTSFDPGELNWNTTYYWRVDQINDAEAGSPWSGAVWSFKVADYLVIAPAQKTLNYINNASPFFTEMAYDVPADWTKNGASALALRFQGAAGAAAAGSTTIDGPGAYTLVGSGTDIWGTSDQFQFGYMQLTGDGSIVAKVESVQNTNGWAKGGVMIRQSVAANSAYAIQAITGGGAANGGGVGFQYRLTAGASAGAGPDGPGVAAPQWVKLERVGNLISGFYSADGVTWTQQGVATEIVMADPVLIGLCYTSHVNATTFGTAKFSNVGVAGGVDPTTAANTDIGLGNSAQPVYVAVEDAAGKIAVATFPEPAATRIISWTSWKIPLTDLAGIDLANVAKLYVGVGDSLNPKADGIGSINVDSVRVVKAVTAGWSPVLVDITNPSDNVLGLPANSNWPAGENPALVFDNSKDTKFLHFSGKTEVTGVQIQPFVGPTVVTGMTFTSANDAAERDPVKFELSGSNDSIKGPWTVIAAGDIADFAGATAWPRKTINATPITFENATAYKFYQVMFPAIRDAAKANSMQIAEVELLGVADPAPKPKVVWVTFHPADGTPSAASNGQGGLTVAADKGYTELLAAQGYDVVRYIQTGTPDTALLNSADLVIVGRSVASGSFNTAAATRWNTTVSTPMIVMNGYLTRKSRLGFMVGSTIPDTTGDISLTATDVAHPIFAGITLGADGTMANPFAGIVTYPNAAVARGISVITEAADAEATVLATASTALPGGVAAGSVMIAELPAGATVEHDGGAADVLAGPRLVFLSGSREASGINSETAGMFDLTADGATMFINAVEYMLLK